MRIFNVLKNGVLTNSWNSDSGKDETHWEPGFGKPQRWVRASEEDVSEHLDERTVVVQEASEEVRDEDDNVTREAQEEMTEQEYLLPAEYEIQIQDVGDEPLWAEIRAKRDQLLASCDWTVLTDSPLNTTQKNEWKAYRQALRDLPESAEDPADIVWPEMPS